MYVVWYAMLYGYKAKGRQGQRHVAVYEVSCMKEASYKQREARRKQM